MDPTTEFRFRLVNTILTALLAFGVIFAALTFRSDIDEMRRDQEQRRRAYTMHLYDEWRRLLDLGDARYTLERIRSEQLNSGDLVRQPGEYTIGEGEDAVVYEEVLRMRQHVVSVLNLFEQVAVASRDNVGDSGMIESYFSGAIVDHFTALSPFMSGWRTGLRRAPAWRVLERTVEDWRDRQLEDDRDPL